MLLSRSFLLALISAPFVVLAQDLPNAPKVPAGGYQPIVAGQSFTLEWNPTTDGTVTLILRSGTSTNLNQGEIIASSIDNSGTYTWDVSSDEVAGSDYTIEIVDDSDPSQTNYTPPLVIDSTNTVATPLSTLTIATSSAPTPSAFPLQSGITLDTVAHHSTTTTGTESSSSAEMTTGTASMTSSPTTPSSSTNGDLMASPTTTNGAARATALVGVLGAVALGALAL